MTALTCLISQFAYPSVTSLGEELVLRADGGAIALFGPTWLSHNGPTTSSAGFLLPRLAAPGGGRLGDRVLRGLNDYAAAGGEPRRRCGSTPCSATRRSPSSASGRAVQPVHRGPLAAPAAPGDRPAQGQVKGKAAGGGPAPGRHRSPAAAARSGRRRPKERRFRARGPPTGR